MTTVEPLPEHYIIDDQSHLLQRQLSEKLEHISLTFRHFRVLIAADIKRASTVILCHVEVQMPHTFEALQYSLVDGIGPSVYVASVLDTDAKAQASDSKVLLVLEACSREALKDISAMNSEGVVRVVDRIGLQVNLTADAKYRQAELIGSATMLLLRGRFVTVLMSIFGCDDVPGNNIRVCRVKINQDLLF